MTWITALLPQILYLNIFLSVLLHCLLCFFVPTGFLLDSLAIVLLPDVFIVQFEGMISLYVLSSFVLIVILNAGYCSGSKFYAGDFKAGFFPDAFWPSHSYFTSDGTAVQRIFFWIHSDLRRWKYPTYNMGCHYNPDNELVKIFTTSQ